MMLQGFETRSLPSGLPSWLTKCWRTLSAALLVVACGSDAPYGPADQAANPCATPERDVLRDVPRRIRQLWRHRVGDRQREPGRNDHVGHGRELREGYAERVHSAGHWLPVVVAGRCS